MCRQRNIAVFIVIFTAVASVEVAGKFGKFCSDAQAWLTMRHESHWITFQLLFISENVSLITFGLFPLSQQTFVESGRVYTCPPVANYL